MFLSQYVNELSPWKIPNFKFQIPIIGFWYFFFLKFALWACGEYRSRTDDLLRARQAL